MKFRKKPVVIDAIRWMGPGDSIDISAVAITRWAREHAPNGGGEPRITIRTTDCTLIISTLEGDMTAQPGDWIICGVKGELYPCKPDIFEATYELVEEAF